MTLARILAATTAMVFAATAAHAESIRIGASLPITGGLSVSGEKHKRGYELCTKLINEAGGILGRQVDLIVSDNRSDPATAINQYERFINVDKVDAVYGTFSSRLTFPVAAILSKYNMVHAVPSGGALRIYEQGYRNLFYFQVSAAEYTGKDVTAVIHDLIPAGEGPRALRSCLRTTSLAMRLPPACSAKRSRIRRPTKRSPISLRATSPMPASRS